MNTEPPVEPFSRDEMKAILNAIGGYPDKQNAIRLQALILLLRYSGLRIGDAVTLERKRIENRGLLLKTEKTGTRVYVPLPEFVIKAIDACPGKSYPFWTGESKRKSVIGDWQRALKTLFELAEVKNAHAHRFRHTFACELLSSGATLTNVSRMLGHSSESITERHYGAWVKSRQESLEADARKGWDMSAFTVTTASQQRHSSK